MKHWLRLGALVLCLLALAAGAAWAEGSSLVLSGSLSPSEMVVPGNATLTLFLHNPSEEKIEDVRVFVLPSSGEPEMLGQFSAIAPGETVELVQTIQVSQAHLDQGEIFVFINNSSVSGEGDVTFLTSGNIGFPIVKVAARVQMEFTRQLSSQYAVRGGEITLAYTARNLGNVDLRQVTIRDELGSFESRVNVLKPGESATVLNHVKITQSEESIASVGYTPHTESASRIQRLASIPVFLVKEGLKVDLTSNVSHVYYGGQAYLSIRVTNTGNVALNTITLTDPALGAIAESPFSLEPGEAAEFFRLTTLFSRRDFQITAHATSPTGNQVEAKSKPVAVEVEAQGDAVFLSIEAVPEMERINRAGQVNFTISLRNNGLGSVSNVAIGEEKAGELYQFALVAAGEPTTRTVTLPVSATSQFRFYYTVSGESGRQSTGYAAPVTVTIAADGETPDPLAAATEPPVLSGESTRPDALNIYPYMIAGALVLLAVLTTLLAVVSHRERVARRLRKKQREEGKREEGKREEGRKK